MRPPNVEFAADRERNRVKKDVDPRTLLVALRVSRHQVTPRSFSINCGQANVGPSRQGRANVQKSDCPWRLRRCDCRGGWRVHDPAGEFRPRRGVYACQAAAGQDLYPSTCPRCHGSDLYGDGFETPALIGSDFQRWWADRTLGDLFEFVSTNMPKSNPGVFDDQTYLDLIAYILRMNGYDVGNKELVPDRQALAEIRMEMVN